MLCAFDQNTTQQNWGQVTSHPQTDTIQREGKRNVGVLGAQQLMQVNPTIQRAVENTIISLVAAKPRCVKVSDARGQQLDGGIDWAICVVKAMIHLVVPSVGANTSAYLLTGFLQLAKQQCVLMAGGSSNFGNNKEWFLRKVQLIHSGGNNALTFGKTK